MLTATVAVSPFIIHIPQAKADPAVPPQEVILDGTAGGKRFDGIGAVDGGGATSPLLKDYPEPQRSQVLDMVFRPKFGASISALYVEIPGDGNSTQGSMPSHMHTADDLNYQRGFTWWLLTEAKRRNPKLSLDGTIWSAPGWIGRGAPLVAPDQPNVSTPKFWTQDTITYYIKWLQGLRNIYHLEFDAIGCRNEKGESYDFVKAFRAALDSNGFGNVKIHAFDNWPPKWAMTFIKDMATDPALQKAIDIVSSHSIPPTPEDKALLAQWNKPYWNTELHIYKKGYDCEISIVQALNHNYIAFGATKVVLWYGIAALYPMQPYSEDPSMILAREPWSGNYQPREALWGYAHYGQFTEVGWQYLNGGCAELTGSGSYVTLKSPGNDYSIIIETKDATAPQQVQFKVGGGLSSGQLCVWRSNAQEQFVQQPGITPANGTFTITLDPNSIYSLSTTTGQQKGSFPDVPQTKPFPFPYYDTFEQYSAPKDYGYLPHYTADIAGAFEIVKRPDNQGQCLRQVVPEPTISWAPDWLPYTIIGDNAWTDYDVSADTYLNPHDTAAVMGRVNDVGTGYGFIPKGYFLQLSDDGHCSLVVVRGKKNKKKVVGDAEQQALIKAQGDDSEGGEKELATMQIPNIKPNEWHNLKLRFAGSAITGLVDRKVILTATDSLYSHGMSGLLAEQSADKGKLSTPYFDNLLVNKVNAPAPQSVTLFPGVTPIYQSRP